MKPTCMIYPAPAAPQVPGGSKAVASLLEALGYPVFFAGEDINDGGEIALETSPAVFLTACAIILARAEAKEATLIVTEERAFINLSRAARWLEEDSDMKARVNRYLAQDGLEYTHSRPVHYLTFLSGLEGLPHLLESTPRGAVALYHGPMDLSERHQNGHTALFEASGWKRVRMETVFEPSGSSLFQSNPALAYRFAGMILAEASDNGGDILGTADIAAYSFWSTKRKAIQKSLGRPCPVGLVHPALLLAKSLSAQKG